jgi:hypothetical protein
VGAVSNVLSHLIVEYASGAGGCDVFAETGDTTWISLSGITYTEADVDNPEAARNGLRPRR